MVSSQFNPTDSSTAMQLFRYAIVGVGSNIAGYCVYLIITYFGLTPKTAMTLLYGIISVISFIGNFNLTFSYKGGMRGSGIRYFFSYLVGYLINLAIIVIFVDHFGYAHQLVQAVAIFVVAAFLFISLKFFVFKVTS